MILLVAGAAGTLLLLFAALSGPATGKLVARRLEVLRERHSRSSEAVAQAQLRKIFAQRQSKSESFAKRFIPNPALLQLRLSQTGKSWTLSQYVMVSVGLAVAMIVLLFVKGLPILLAVTVGLLIGVALPHMVISSLIKRRVQKFTSKFPDAIELIVRGLRSGLPISETIGIVADELPEPVNVEFRSVSDKMRIGRTLDAALQDTAARPNSSSS
jgi:tight adherence protein B